MLTSVTGLLVALSMAGVARPQTEDPPERVAPIDSEASGHILLLDDVLVFELEGVLPRRVPLLRTEIAGVSPAGRVCAVYDHESRAGRILASTGDQVGGFRTELPYAGVEVSDAGFVLLHHPVYLDGPNPDDVLCLDETGRELMRLREFFSTPFTHYQLAPDGDGFAAAGLDREQNVATRVDTTGRLWSQRLPDGYSVNDIAFDTEGRRTAFALSHRERLDDHQVLIFGDGGRPTSTVEVIGLRQRIGADTVAFGTSGRRLYVAGQAQVQCFDSAFGTHLWTNELNAAHRTRDLLDIGVRVVALERSGVLVAHAVSAPRNQIKYAISRIDEEGRTAWTHLTSKPFPRQALKGTLWHIEEEAGLFRLFSRGEGTTLSLTSGLEEQR